MQASRDQSFKNNCLSLIKLLAAFEVMTGHLVTHLKLPISNAGEFVLYYYLGVPVFFVISGYLIWMSIVRSNSYSEYLKKRFWRIYPELWCAVAVEIITIVLLYTGYKGKDLLAFTFTQATVLQFWTPDSLRGYGCGTPNGTLWTMSVMIQFYIVSWFIYKLYHKKSISVWIITLLALIGFSMLGQIMFDNIGIEVLTKLYSQTIIRYGWLFFFGCFMAEHKKLIVDGFLVRYWYIILILAVVPYATRFDLYAGYYVAHSCLLVSGLIGFAYAYPKLAVKPDLSYGIFLYHMIVVNVFINFGLVKNWAYAAAVTVITVLLSFVSMKTIGTWSAKRKVTLHDNNN